MIIRENVGFLHIRIKKNFNKITNIKIKKIK